MCGSKTPIVQYPIECRYGKSAVGHGIFSSRNVYANEIPVRTRAILEFASFVDPPYNGLVPVMSGVTRIAKYVDTRLLNSLKLL